MDAQRSVLGTVGNQEEKMVLWSAHISGHITVHMMPLYWIKERGQRWLGVTLTLLGKM